MIIDDERRKVIFVHIPKCGGVSVERSIHKALGGNDAVIYHKLIRAAPSPQEGNFGGLGLHSTMKDFRRYYGNRFPEFYKFSIVRNPWRRMVSHYEYLMSPMWNNRISEKDKMDFPTFIQVWKTNLLAYSMINGYNTFLDDGRGTKLNYVGKLENINEDLPKIGLDIKLEILDVLHMNRTDPKDKEHDNWKDYYNPGLIDRVYKIYKEDIEKYNYEFEEA